MLVNFNLKLTCRFAIIGMVFSCSLFGCMSNKEIIEMQINRQIGGSVVGSYFELPSVEKIDRGDFLEYIRHDKWHGCDIGYIVDKKSMLILSWHYLSQPEKCWTRQGSN